MQNRLKGVDAIDINGCIDRKSVERSLQWQIKNTKSHGFSRVVEM